MTHNSDELHKDQELRIRMLEAAIGRLTQIVEHFEKSDDDKELRLRKIEAMQAAATAVATADPEKKKIISSERIIWALIAIVSYLLKIPLESFTK